MVTPTDMAPPPVVRKVPVKRVCHYFPFMPSVITYAYNVLSLIINFRTGEL